MSAQVFQLRTFQAVRDRAQVFGDQVKDEMIRRVKQEQAAGKTGNGVLGEVMDMRRRFSQGWEPPTGGNAA